MINNDECSIIYIIFMFSDACAINDHSTDTVILVGGKDTKNSVTRYNSHGFVEDLPSLIEGRYGGHGCGAYLRQDGSQVQSILT